MHLPPCNTLVRAVDGTPELRRATPVREWRIEPALDADGLVISIEAPGGEVHSFLIGEIDAQDIGEVLRHRTPVRLPE